MPLEGGENGNSQINDVTHILLQLVATVHARISKEN